MGYPAASKIPRPTHSVVATVPLAQGTGVGKGQDTEQHQVHSYCVVKLLSSCVC